MKCKLLSKFNAHNYLLVIMEELIEEELRMENGEGGRWGGIN